LVEGTCKEDTSCATQKNAAESTPIEEMLYIVAILASALLRLLEAKGTPLEVLSIVVVVVPMPRKRARVEVRCQTTND